MKCVQGDAEYRAVTIDGIQLQEDQENENR